MLKIVPRALEFPFGFRALGFAPAYACRFFKEIAPVFGLRRKHLIDLSLFHDRIGRFADARIHKKRAYFARACLPVIDKVFVFAGTIEPPFDRDFGRFEGDEPVFVHDRERYFGNVEGRAALGAVEDDVFHLVGTQIFRAVFG